MKTLLTIAAVALMLFVASCSDKSDKLTEVDISELKVPQSFDYTMSRMVEVNLQGAHRLPLTISTEDGKVLYRAMINPATGLSTKINLASTIKRVVIAYHVREVHVNVSGNSISYNFNN